MPYSPLVSKIRVHNPNKKGSSSANRNYVTYIATREGVSLEQIEDINELLMSDDMLRRDLNENIIYGEADNEQYLRYIAKRPRSHGLFGNINTDDLKQISSDIAKLTKSGRIIYRGVISLGEKDGEALGFRNANAWNNYLMTVMPGVAEKLGINTTDYTWVAAFHAEEKHPHVHYMLWDNRDSVKSPFIHKATQQEIRIFLEEQMFDNEYERAVREVIYEECREEIDAMNSLRNTERAHLVETASRMIDEIRYVPGIEYERLPQRPPKEYLEKLADQAEKLIAMLPEKGSLDYQYLPPETKQQMDKIVSILLERPDMQAAMQNYLECVGRVNQMTGKTQTKIASMKEKAEQDLRKRVANRVIKELKPILRKEAEIRLYAENQLEEPDSPNTDEAAERKNKYYIAWNKEYKKAMKKIYGGTNELESGFKDIEKLALDGNALAINEAAKLIEQKLVDVPEQESVNYYNTAYRAFLSVYNNDLGYQEYAAYRLGKLYDYGKGDLEIDYKEAGEWYKKAEDNKYAQYSLAKLYLSEKIYFSDKHDIHENQEAALELLKKSEKNGNAYASYMLGNMYLRGMNVFPDKERADQHYKKALEGFHRMAANSTDDTLFYRMGRMYYDGLGTEKNMPAGEVYIQRAADLGNVNAKLKLFSIYLEKENIEFREKAIEMLKELADDGNDMAQYKLGVVYTERELEFYNFEEGFRYLQMSAEQKNQYAEYKLGMIYLREDFAGHDISEAIKYLTRSAEQMNEFARYRLGTIYADEKYQDYYNMEKAVKFWSLSAEQGNQFAQYRLGVLYGDEGNEKYYDLPKAVNYLESSAEQGNQFAQYRLGVIYSTVEDKEHYDISKATDYLEASAEQGNEYAQYRLGVLYGDEENEKYYDLPKSISYLESSAEQGNQFAQYRLGMIYGDEGNEKYYDLPKAVNYLESSAEQGNQFAQYRLGIIYLDVKSEYTDIVKALEVLRKSAEQGNQFAQYQLGKIYNDHESAYYNEDVAVEYFKLSAGQENSYAQYELGKIYADDKSKHYNIGAAEKYLTASAEHGNQYAQYRLGYMYFFGKNVLRDEAIGRYWLERAAAQGNEPAQAVLLGQTISIDFSYCLLKGALSSLEGLNRQAEYESNEYLNRSHSRQARREKYLHKDNLKNVIEELPF